jgi:hypothetical protein
MKYPVIEDLKLRQWISEKISDNCNLIHSDVNTFIWVKTDISAQFKDVPENYFIGGGNLLMVHGLFAVINFIAKAYTMLVQGYDLSEDNEKQWQQLLVDDPEFAKKYKTYKNKGYIYEKFSVINEEVAFKRLIKNADINWGYDDQQLSQIWKYYRNKLTHMAVPGGIIGADAPAKISYPSAWLKYYSINSPPFVKHSKKELYACDANLLNRDTKKLVEWVCNQLFDRNKYSQAQILRLAQWLESEKA